MCRYTALAMVSNANRATTLDAPDLPISRTLRIRGTRQNVSTDHLHRTSGRGVVELSTDRRVCVDRWPTAAPPIDR
jgi:hypothetical protein